MPTDRVPAADLKDLFGQVSHEIRIRILTELWGADEQTLSFSTLRERVDVRDPGNFNYHLGSLTPELLRRDKDGYTLTYAGRQVVGAAVAGSYTDATELDVGPVDAGACPSCGGSVETVYEDGDVVMDCGDCGDLIASLPAPPIVIAAHDSDALPKVVSDHFQTQSARLTRGFCKLCDGPVSATPTVATDGEAVTNPPELDVTFTCETCGDITHLNVGVVALHFPELRAFLHENGVNIRDHYLWELDFLLKPNVSVSGDPFRMELVVTVGDEVLALTVDESLALVEYERR
ncbi:DUF7351 domain-containing protein [Halobacterium yunchengense]|uniref:DUF7351 domain-containing protein n=1 Tax=Halobacterium yunchengense TaxID=3108497 RepID=UPI00300894CF